MDNFFRSTRCKANFHKFDDDWKFVQDKNCKRTRTCSLCGKTQTEIKHDWGRDGFVANGNCEKVRRCKRCGEVKPGSNHIEHNWDKEEQVADGKKCVKAIYCIRCRKEKPNSRKTIHSYNENGRFLSEDDCIMEITCTVCGEVDKVPKHDMGYLYLVDRSCETTYGCKRCHYMPDNLLVKGLNAISKVTKSHVWTDDDWVYVHPENTDNCWKQRHCPRCGEFDKRKLEHDWEWKRGDPCSSKKICRRCRKVEYDEANHNWELEHTAYKSCIEIWRCSKCDSFETRETHSWSKDPVSSKEAAEEIGISRLIGLLQKDHSDKVINALTLQQRWRDIQDEKKQHGSNETIRVEISKIKTGFVQLAWDVLHQQVSFEELAGEINFIPQENGLYLVVDESGDQIQLCRKCGAYRKN